MEVGVPGAMQCLLPIVHSGTTLSEVQVPTVGMILKIVARLRAYSSRLIDAPEQQSPNRKI